MNNKRILTVILIVLITSLIIGCNNTVSIDKDTIIDKPTTKLKAIDCLPEQRGADGCIEIYQPVCGQVQVECITTPCNPVKETYENSCKACVNSRVFSYTEGECTEDNGVKK
jgi:hypothetical protein